MHEYHSLLSGENKKNMTNLSSAKFANEVLKFKKQSVTKQTFGQIY